MKKNVIQDIIPPKKSIRNIELPSRPHLTEEKFSAVVEEVKGDTPKLKHINKQIEKVNHQKENRSTLSYKYEYDEPTKSSKKILYTAIGLFILAIVFGISALFKGAEIKLIPKQETKSLNETFTAMKDVTTGLGFQLVTITKDVEREIEATGQEEVLKKARGRIIIYNNYSIQPQKLIATTRFQTDEGLIFKLINGIIVPGQQIKNGKTVAGSIEVTVEADEAGVGYNIGLKDFNIPSFKGGPKYSKIYARSKTTMTGGFSGIQKVASLEAVNKVNSELEVELKNSLSRDIVSQIPSNFVLYQDSLYYNFDPINQVNGADKAIFRKKGVAHAIIFDKSSLTKVIVTKILPEISQDIDIIKIINLDKLDFSYKNKDLFNPNTDTSVTFELKGEPNFVWVFDENKLRSDLLGLSKKNARLIIETYRNIKEASIETRPFWNQTIPKNPKKVNLINTVAQ